MNRPDHPVTVRRGSSEWMPEVESMSVRPLNEFKLPPKRPKT